MTIHSIYSFSASSSVFFFSSHDSVICQFQVPTFVYLPCDWYFFVSFRSRQWLITHVYTWLYSFNYSFSYMHLSPMLLLYNLYIFLVIWSDGYSEIMQFTIPGGRHAVHHAGLLQKAGAGRVLRAAAAATTASIEAKIFARIVLRNLEHHQSGTSTWMHRGRGPSFHPPTMAPLLKGWNAAWPVQNHILALCRQWLEEPMPKEASQPPKEEPHNRELT